MVRNMSVFASNDDTASKSSVVQAIYNLYIYDQLHEEHIQKEGEEYFLCKSHDGFCSKVTLNEFNSSKSGLLVNDCCVFGADVLEAFACKLDKEGISETCVLIKEYQLGVARVLMHAGMMYKIHREDFFSTTHASLKHPLWFLE